MKIYLFQKLVIAGLFLSVAAQLAVTTYEAESQVLGSSAKVVDSTGVSAKSMSTPME